MFKQIILPLLAVIVFIVVVGLFIQKSTPTASPQKTITIDNVKIGVQVADTEAKRTKGLSGVAVLDAASGMLFVFGSKGVTPIFWMKDMLIPLDIIWISGGKIVRIDKNIPSPTPGTPDINLKTYSAGQPIDYVLEVNAQFADKNKIKVGDAVDLTGI
jgi:uncharacterized membrane protein (UPF0127 family)